MKRKRKQNFEESLKHLKDWHLFADAGMKLFLENKRRDSVLKRRSKAWRTDKAEAILWNGQQKPQTIAEPKELRGIRAGANKWVILEHLRNYILERTIALWRENAKRVGYKNTSVLPFTTDDVMELYFRYRKRNPKEIAGFIAEIADAFSRPRQKDLVEFPSG